MFKQILTLLAFLSSPLTAATDWPAYFEGKLQYTNPSIPITRAIVWHESQSLQPSLAYDLACGTGNDTLYLLSKGWHVIAMDAEPLALEITSSRTPESQLSNLQTIVDTFQTIQLPDNLDLVNASLAIPFCDPSTFPTLWDKITTSLKPGGIFSGHFFGNNHVWSTNPDMTFHKEQDLLDLLNEDYEILSFENIDNPNYKIVAGTIVRWHVFNVVINKKTKG